MFHVEHCPEHEMGQLPTVCYLDVKLSKNNDLHHEAR